MKIGASRIHQGPILLLGRVTRSDRQREAKDLIVIAGAKGSGDSRLEWEIRMCGFLACRKV
jgi:uncharacterized ferredoxin-like protein